MIPSLAYYAMILRNEFVEFCNEKLQEIGLTQGQLFFIIYIGKHKDCSPKQLAKDLHMDSGHATRTISKLVEQGFLQQTVNEKDKRAHVLQLTKQGEAAFQLSFDLFHQWDNTLLKEMPAQQQAMLMELMERLVHRKEGDLCV